MLNKLFNAFGGRRYFFAQQVFIVAILLLLKEKIKAEHFVDITVWTLAIYAGANVVQKVADIRGKKNYDDIIKE